MDLHIKVSSLSHWISQLFIDWELWLKGFLSAVKMNVRAFWAIFLPLKSNTPGPFSIMRSSPLLKHNISLFIPRVCSTISIFWKIKQVFMKNEITKSVFWHFWLISIRDFLRHVFFWQIPNQKEIIVNQISKKCFLINHPISEYLSNISRDSIYQTVMPNMHTDGYFNNL